MVDDVIMKVDLVGPRRRGLALGLNEASGYGAVAIADGYRESTESWADLHVSKIRVFLLENELGGEDSNPQ